MTPTRSEKIEERLARESAKRKMQFVVFIGAFCAFVVLYAALGPSGGEGDTAGDADSTAGSGEAVTVEGVPLEELLQQSPDERKSQAEETREILADYEARVMAAPEAAETPGLLSASGNLYKQKLGDYAKAAEQYELLLADYPDWEGIAKVYPELATCYERLDEEDKLRDLYREMTERFPPETAEHQWAADKLGLRVEVVPTDEAIEEESGETPPASP